jgi:hypothetical protein
MYARMRAIASGTAMTNLEDYFGPELSKVLDLKFEQLDIQPEPAPICQFCTEVEAVYRLAAIRLLLQTPDHAKHLVESRPTQVIATCIKDKNFDTEEYLAGAAHLTIMHETSVSSTLEDFEVLWKML